MSNQPKDRNTILPRDNSQAPSLVLYEVDKEQQLTSANQRGLALTDHADNENPPDKTIMTTSGNLMTQQQDISLLNNTDNQLMQNIAPRSNSSNFQASLPARRPSDRSVEPIAPVQSLSANMAVLKQAVQEDSPHQLVNLAQRSQINDAEEALMLMYVSVAIMNTAQVFKTMMQKHQGFKTKPVWHVLFSSPNIFQILQGSPTMAERLKFDEIVLKVALERDLNFIIEAVLDRAVFTPQLLNQLLLDNQQNMIVELLTKTNRPLFISDQLILGGKGAPKPRDSRKGRKEIGLTKKLQFVHIIESMIDFGQQSNAEIIDMMRLMQQRVEQAKPRLSINNEDDDEKLLDYDELYKLFIVKRKIKLLRYLFSLNRNIFDFNADLFLKALELEAYDMAALLFKEFFRLLRNLEPQQLEFAVSQIVSSFNRANGMIDFKCYLARQFIEQMQLRHARSLLDAIRNKFKTVSKQNILVMNLNVLKTACLLIEILADIGLKFNHLQVRCSNLRNDIIQVTRKYMSRVESEYEMKYLLLEKDFEHRDSLDLITKHNIVEFLESQLAENVVKEIWRSAYATQDSIMSASTNYMLTFKFWDCIRDLEYDQSFLKMKDVTKIEAHIFQFTVWRFSPKARMLQEFLVTLIFTYIIDTLINSFLNLVPPLEEFEFQLFDMEEKLAQIPDKQSPEYVLLEAKTLALQYYFEPMRLEFYNSMMMLTYVFFAVLFFAIQHVPEIIYTTITRRQFDAYSYKNLLDFILFILFFSFICISYGNNLNGSWKEQLVIGEQTRADIFARNFFSGQPKLEQLLLLLCILAIWCRLFYLFVFNTMFGTLWGILSRLLPTLTSYIFFYFVEVIFFSLVAELAFRELVLYNTFENAFYTLFYSGFGFFDYDDFEKETQFGYYFGLLFILAFLIANLGLITSIFTSVIVVHYDESYNNKSIFTMLETLRVRPVMQADKEYSSLISLPPPFNGLLFFLAPFLMTTKNPEVLNKVILSIAYLPLLLLTFAAFALFNIVLLPITYIKMFFHKMVMIFVYSKSYRVSRADKFMLWIMFAIIGPFRLTANVLVDLIAFLKHCVLQELPKTRVSIREKPLAKQTIRMAAVYFKNRKERLIMFKQAAGELRDQMSIFQKIGQIFIPQPVVNFMANQRAAMEAGPASLLSEREFETVFAQIREYSTIKQILEGNSEKVIFNKQRVKSVDCQILNVLLEDVLRHKTVSKVEDENYIFIRRALDIKTKAQMDRKADEKAKLGSDVELFVHAPLTNVDVEARNKIEKRLKHAVRKLINLNTSRMLDVLGYSTTEKDVRRLDYAIKSFGSENALLQRKLKQLSFGHADSSKDDQGASLQSFFGAESGSALEERISQLGMGIPRLDYELQNMQQEIQKLVENYTETTKAVQGAQNRELKASNTIKNLKEEMNQLRGGKDQLGSPSTLDKFIKNDYFYKELSGKPQVRFFDESAPDKSLADPVDAIMDQRPARNILTASEAKRRKFVTSSSFGRSETQLLNTQTNLQRQLEQKKQQKTISLAQLRQVSKNQQLKASLASGEPNGLFAKGGEDSDVPYISDNSAGL